ncbi:MAG: hypothetical protein KatS3mg038_3128 [Candidatus Kapaibacterium sp.]|nr:MAG: hypothetical protein KatS3mg038_1609 [Candidatus Kapabacteria bacterium]GIV52607.1 MAG: hypothetical protein KatS3mg038_3128 [Candidatus Kapabacteria bacterium]
MNFSEHGGGSTSKGAAQIICAADGSRLVSCAGYAVSNGIHAVFCPADNAFPIMIVQYSHNRGAGHGTVYLVDQTGANTPIFEFEDADDRGIAFHVTTVGAHEYAFPYQAVRAAWTKARDYHCRRAYYALGRYAGGRSGPKGLGGGPSILKTGGLKYRPAQGDTP